MSNLLFELTAKELNTLLNPHLTKLAAELAKHYDSKMFVSFFLEREWYRTLCGLCVHEFEKDCAAYQEDEKICDYVEKLNIDEKKKKLLKRSLVMIKTIRG